MPDVRPQLFTPFRLRGVEIRNRVVISPMCQYSATDGMVNDWHLVQLGRYAMGGAGLVFVEATAVEPEGRITHGDLGLWDDGQIAGQARLAAFIKGQGATPAIQLGHAGRKAGMQRPWYGNGPLNDADRARGDVGWTPVSASDLPVDEGWPVPRPLTAGDMARIRDSWVAAARRAAEAGFEVLELHCAHGYLLHQFLSPISNVRTDDYGGSLDNRCRFPLEVARALRAAWPGDRPLLVRVSAVDGTDEGWQLDDTLHFAHALKEIGVDLIDCSSGGIGGSATASRLPRGLGFQVPFAETVRRETGLPTMAVGLIRDPAQAEAVVADGRADLVAIGREALFNPNWALHAEQELRGGAVFDAWPRQFGWWLERRAPGLERMAADGVDVGPPVYGTRPA